MPGMVISFEPGTAAAVAWPPLSGDQGVRLPVDDEEGQAHAVQPLGAVGRGEDGGQLAGRAVGAVASGRTRRRPCCAAGRLRPSGTPASRSPGFRPGWPRWPPRGSSPRAAGARVIASAVGAPTDRSPVVDMMEQADKKRSGWLMHQGLGDHAPHRDADHVGPLRCRAAVSSAAASSAMSSTR